MKYDDRPEPAKRLEKARISRGFKSARAAAKYFGWIYESYSQHESGIRGLSRVAEKYAMAFRISEGWLLTGEGDKPEEPKVPLLGIAAGSITGFNIMHENPIDYVDRPPMLANVTDAYAVMVRGSSMNPRYEENDLCFVHPHKAPSRGDYIIIQQISNNGSPVAFIKKMISKTDKSLVAEQLNPHATIEYEAKSVIAIHKVLSMNELFGV